MTNYIAWIQPVNNALGDDGVVIASLKEGSHKISAELLEKIMSGKKYFKYSVVEEELGLTFDKVEDDPGQEQLKNAIQKKLEVKIWLINPKIEPEGDHKAIFCYTAVEEYEGGWEEEEDTIETTHKIQIESVNMRFPKLDDAILDPSSALTVEAELPGEWTGPLESRTQTPGTSVTVNSLSLDKESTTVAVGATEQLTATTDPTGQPVTYAVTSGGSYATVTSSGLLSGVAEGTATVEASSGGKTDTITVTVTA